MMAERRRARLGEERGEATLFECRKRTDIGLGFELRVSIDESASQPGGESLTARASCIYLLN